VVLAGDIGGTNARLALFESRAGIPSLVAVETYPSRAHAGLKELLLAFRERHGQRLEAAVIGIAGPVAAGRVTTTNLPWADDAVELARVLEVREVVLMNDLEALAWSLDLLTPGGLADLQAGSPTVFGDRGVIAAGTGLGEAVLARVGDRAIVLASEGGHADFAPRTETEIALLRWLVARHGRASWERVLSGRGLHEVYLFLREARGRAEPAWLAEELRVGDPAAAISGAALAGTSELCAEALDLFASVYGAEAGKSRPDSRARGAHQAAPPRGCRWRSPVSMSMWGPAEPFEPRASRPVGRVALENVASERPRGGLNMGRSSLALRARRYDQSGCYALRRTTSTTAAAQT
jgi:glucokinase